jgi:hypothetical protein
VQFAPAHLHLAPLALRLPALLVAETNAAQTRRAKEIKAAQEDVLLRTANLAGATLNATAAAAAETSDAVAEDNTEGRQYACDIFTALYSPFYLTLSLTCVI